MNQIAVGFDVGGTNVRGIPLGQDGAFGPTVATLRPEDPDELVEVLADLTSELARAENSEVASVGVGCAGIVDTRGMVRSSPNISSLVEYPLKDRLDGRLGLETVVDNDATAATWAEVCLGAARGSDDVVFVALGTGIGAGLVVGGALHRGSTGFAGEVGHMTIAHGGIACVCGRSGCWERYASGTAFGRLAREAAAQGRADSLLALAHGDPQAVTSEDAATLISQGDPEALAVLAELGYWTAVGLANLVNMVDPETIVIGGGVAEIGQPLVDAIAHAYQQVMVDASVRDPLPIKLSQFRGRSGSIGAALLGKSPGRQTSPR